MYVHACLKACSIHSFDCKKFEEKNKKNSQQEEQERQQIRNT